MAINRAMLPEFDHEMANTRKTLERIADDKFDWKPHRKSFSMGALSTHIANLPGWAGLVMASESFDMAPPGEESPRTPPAESRAQVLEEFDKNAAGARKAIEAASDEDLMKTWTLLKGGHAVLSMPRVAVLRGFVMNHMIHHRAQLSVYLRLNDIPVPSLYGPSADEEM